MPAVQACGGLPAPGGAWCTGSGTLLEASAAAVVVADQHINSQAKLVNFPPQQKDIMEPLKNNETHPKETLENK